MEGGFLFFFLMSPRKILGEKSILPAPTLGFLFLRRPPLSRPPSLIKLFTAGGQNFPFWKEPIQEREKQSEK